VPAHKATGGARGTSLCIRCLLIQAVTTWVKPLLIAKVKFSERTNSGGMRHLLGLRSDKPAEDVTRERDKPRIRPAAY